MRPVRLGPRGRRLRALTGLVALALGLVAPSFGPTASVAHAAGGVGATASPFVVDWARDWSLSAGGLVTSLLLDAAVGPALQAAPSCRAPTTGSARCDGNALWALDRVALGQHSAGWRRTSDVLQVATLASALLGTAALAAYDARGTAPVAAALTDFTVGVQAVAAATALSTTLKYAVRRPRPAYYRPYGGAGVQQVLSWPSGHTTAVAAASTALATTVQLRRPRGPWRFLAWTGAAAVTTIVASGRVLGGKHFPSDVLAGAAVGAAIGIAVPLAHRAPVALVPCGHGGFGLTLTLPTTF